MDLLPKELWISILSNLTLSELILIERVNLEIKEIVRTTPWSHFFVTLCKLITIQFVIRNYHFMRYKLRNATDNEVSLLGGCHTLDLANCCNITDNSVSLLGGCHNLRLCICDLLTDKSIRKLKNCNYLSLPGCSKITDTSILKLTKCRELYVYSCPLVTKRTINILKQNGCDVQSFICF